MKRIIPVLLTVLLVLPSLGQEFIVKKRKVAYLVSQPREISIKLDDLGANFAVKEIYGNDKVDRATGNSISVMPSVYVLNRKGVDLPQGVRTSYVPVASTLKSLTVVHNPQKIVTAGKIEIKAKIRK